MKESDQLMSMLDKEANARGWNGLGSAAPIFETDMAETLGIRKFLEMSMADLRDQIKRASKDPRIAPKRFRQMKTHATILTAWMVSALEMVDNMLAEAKAREPVVKEVQKQ